MSFSDGGILYIILRINPPSYFGGLKFEPDDESVKDSQIYKRVFNSEMRNFPQDQGNLGIARRRTRLYVAQAILKIDTEVAENGHFWIEN